MASGKSLVATIAHPGLANMRARQPALTFAIDISVIDADYAFAETKVLHC